MTPRAIDDRAHGRLKHLCRRPCRAALVYVTTQQTAEAFWLRIRTSTPVDQVSPAGGEAVPA